MEVKELTEKEFRSTFSEKMNNVTNSMEPIVDIWGYVSHLEKGKYFLNDHIIRNEIIESVYRNSEGTYDQTLIPTSKKNVYLIIIVKTDERRVFGHYLLDLNKEYGVHEN
ncbi:MAG: hypothetical protein LBV38_00405 [Alistipes sp.]|jgi:hypothetical protein|nr:hypothetical protein [Alistipes sp.]